MSLCQYKDLIGAPGTGAHSYRVFNVAVVDTLTVLAFCIIVSLLTGWKLIGVVIIVFALGLFVHKIFCVETTLTKLLL